MNVTERLQAELAEKRAAEGKSADEPKSRPKRVERNDDKPDVFALARTVDTAAVLDRLGIEHGEKFAVCPGCSEDGALIGKNGGIKCLHARCANVGPPGHPGFRSTIDLVMDAEHLDNIEAAERICEWGGIDVPERKTAHNANEWNADDYPEADGEPAAPEANSTPATVRRSKPSTLADIVDRWSAEGPLVRVPTGIEPLDRLSRGGLPVPSRVIIVGAPSAGKTAVSIIIADKMARAAEAAGMCIGVLGVDEEPEDLAVRLLQIAGYSLEEAEEREPLVLAQMRTAVDGLRIRLYDDEFTIESAAADLAEWAKTEGRRAALFLDSLHAVRSLAGLDAQNPRESVEANVRAMRAVATRFRLLVVASAEANRNAYRDADAAQTTNDLAAGAESRAVEFGAQTQLMLRTPKDHPNVIHVRVAKNRRADRGEFWLRLDRGRHAVEECPDPMADPAAAAAKTEARLEGVRAGVLRDAEALAALLVRHPDGLSESDLRSELRAAGHRWGIERLGAARTALSKGHKGVRLVSSKEGKRMVSKLLSDAPARTEP